MTPPTVTLTLAMLITQRVQLRADGGQLRVSADVEPPTILLEQILQSKPVLLVLLHTIKQLKYGGHANPRFQAAVLLRATRQAGRRDLAADLRFAWRERVAICAEHGHLTDQDAEAIAADELWQIVMSWTGDRS